MVYDITDNTTFESIRTWMAQIKMHADVGVNSILVGNKSDLAHQRVRGCCAVLSLLLVHFGDHFISLCTGCNVRNG